MNDPRKTAAEGSDRWESGELGRSEEFLEHAPPELKKQIDDALDLQMISIRLNKALLTDLKSIAEYRCMGYQPLVREVLTRFARAELQAIARDQQEEKQGREIVSRELERRARTA